MELGQSNNQGRRPPPLGLVGRSRGGFLPRPGETAQGASGLPPLGLTGRAAAPAQQSFVIGQSGFEPKRRETVVPVRRVGLTRPRRPPPAAQRPPPAADESGPSNWGNSSAGTGGGSSSNYVGFSLAGLGGLGFGGVGTDTTGSAFTFGNSSGATFGFGNSSGAAFGFGNSSGSTFGNTTNSTFGNTSSMFSDGGGHDVSNLFENADEHAPSQGHVQAPPRRVIDLNAWANRQTREYYSTEMKRHIYATILMRNGTGHRMKHGVSASVARDLEVPRRVVGRIWTMGRLGGTINAVKFKRKGNSGRKKIPFDAAAMEAIPPTERTTLEALSEALNMKKSTLHRRLKEKKFRRCSSELKPSITPENIKQRLEYCLRNLEPASLAVEPTFKAGFNVVHIDEKWFHRTQKTENVYLTNTEEPPKRETKNKGHIQKIMFLSAMTRPRYDRDGNCTFDGKIGVWPYVEWVQAQKRSKNRLRGTWELKPMNHVGKADSREYLVKYVLPAIKNKWPLCDRWNTIYIQQDNAKTHVACDDPIVVSEAVKGNWDIRMVFQPPNSPDMNILDLGWFASIQSMFQKKFPKTLKEIVEKVDESLVEYPHEKLNRIFLTHQNCMRAIIKHKGSIHYDLPHMKKKALERQGLLPVRLKVDKDFVDAAVEFLNSQ
ncbi:hypothetical protein ACQ4PT_065325 [Festuca glaucescens]